MSPIDGGTALPVSCTLARQFWLHQNRISAPPNGARDIQSVIDTVQSLGMVQLDSVNCVARAHQHILWSRHSSWRSHRFDTLLTRRRAVFEHFTHDAALLPMQVWPYWQRQLQRRAERYIQGSWGKAMSSPRERLHIVDRIAREGPLSSRDFDSGKPDRKQHAWMRPPHKLALDYLWLSGDLAISHRKNFIKYYDLTERVIPDKVRQVTFSEDEQVDWLCAHALNTLGMATASDLQRFWDAVTLAEAQQWIHDNAARLQRIDVTDYTGVVRTMHAPADIEDRLQSMPEATSRLRVISPFDPAVRDRQRLERLFGFQFRIEIYTPAAQRRYGYYVYPLLEGARFIGRVDLQADRDAGRLRVNNWWLEPGVKATQARINKLSRELERLRLLADVASVSALPPRQEAVATTG